MAFDGSLPGPQGGGGRAWRRSEAAWLHLQNAHPAGTCHGFTLHCSISPLRAARKGGKVRPVAQSEAIQITLVCPDLSRARSTCGCAAGKNGCYDTANPGARNRAGVVRSRASWPPCGAPRAGLPQAAGPGPASAAAGRAGSSDVLNGGTVTLSWRNEPGAGVKVPGRERPLQPGWVQGPPMRMFDESSPHLNRAGWPRFQALRLSAFHDPQEGAGAFSGGLAGRGVRNVRGNAGI